MTLFVGITDKEQGICSLSPAQNKRIFIVELNDEEHDILTGMLRRGMTEEAASFLEEQKNHEI
jgi:hypothetical protein